MISQYRFLLDKVYFLNVMTNAEFGVKQEKKKQTKQQTQTHKTPFPPKEFPKPLFTLRVYLQTCRMVKELFIYRNFAM